MKDLGKIISATTSLALSNAKGTFYSNIYQDLVYNIDATFGNFQSFSS